MSYWIHKLAILAVFTNFKGGQVRAGKMYFWILKRGVGGLSRDSGGDEVGNKSK